MKYRKKPVVIDAMQYRPINENIDYAMAFDDWMNMVCPEAKYVGMNLKIPTLEGTMEASPGDYIIVGVKGEVYPCKPNIFEQTYEKV